VETADSSATQVLKAKSTEGVISFRVPDLKVYSLVRLSFTLPRQQAFVLLDRNGWS